MRLVITLLRNLLGSMHAGVRVPEFTGHLVE